MDRLKKAKEDMERDVPYDELQSRLVARKELYDALENLSECAQKARAAREGKMTERAINKDAEAKTDELLMTKEGQKRLKYEVQVQYGQELLHKWSDGNRFQAALAPLFQPPEEEMVPLATTVAVAVVPQSSLAAAREAARTVILDEHREECREEAIEKLEQKKRDQIQQFAKMFEEFEGEYGTVNTKWERLWDNASYAKYWYNWESGATEWTRYDAWRGVRANWPLTLLTTGTKHAALAATDTAIGAAGRLFVINATSSSTRWTLNASPATRPGRGRIWSCIRASAQPSSRRSAWQRRRRTQTRYTPHSGLGAGAMDLRFSYVNRRKPPY